MKWALSPKELRNFLRVCLYLKPNPGEVFSLRRQGFGRFRGLIPIKKIHDSDH